MRLLKVILIFQRKIFLPAIVTACVTGAFAAVAEGSFFTGVGIGYFFWAPLCHYTVYEIRRRNEYYFYNNLGLGKPALWTSTVIVGILVCILCLAL